MTTTVPVCDAGPAALCAAAAPTQLVPATVATGQEGRPSRKPSSGRRPVRLLAHVATAIALIALVAAQRSLLGESVSTLRSLRWGWVPVLLLADYASRAAVARTHRRLLRAGGTRISQQAALQVAYAANAMSVTLPVAGAQVGAAFTFRRFLRAGASPATTAWTLLVSGIAATSSFAALLAVAAIATGTVGGVVLGLGGALLAALPGWAVLAGLRSVPGRRKLRGLAACAIAGWRRVTRTAGPEPEAALEMLLNQLTALRLPARDRAAVVALALVNWLADCLCLAAAILAVGATVPWQGLLLAYLTAAGATALALTPGGLGTVELALTAALVATGLDAPHALAATLVYRIASLWLPAVIGWLIYLRTHNFSHVGAVSNVAEDVARDKSPQRIVTGERSDDHRPSHFQEVRRPAKPIPAATARRSVSRLRSRVQNCDSQR